MAQAQTLYWIVNGTVTDELEIFRRGGGNNMVILGDMVYGFYPSNSIRAINATSNEKSLISFDLGTHVSEKKYFTGTTNDKHFLLTINPSSSSRGRTRAESVAVFDADLNFVGQYASPNEMTAARGFFFVGKDLYVKYSIRLYLVTLDLLGDSLFAPFPLLLITVVVLLLTRRRIRG